MKLYLLSTLFASEKDRKLNESKEDNKESNKRNNHFGRIYFDIINNDKFKNLSGAAVKVYVVMLKFADWRTGKCYPSQEKIASLCGYKRIWVNKRIKELVEYSFIRKEAKIKTAPVYYITAYEKQLVSDRIQACIQSDTSLVFNRIHKQESLKDINTKLQQTGRDLQFEDVISTTGGGSETVESVCCRISNIFVKKFHTELPAQFIKEKINSGEVFDDQFYIEIIRRCQRMPDNPIGWWRSIDSTWVVDPNARPVDRVGRGWRVHTSTEDYDVEDERRKEESESLRAKAEQILIARLQSAVKNFPKREEYAEQVVQKAINARNVMMETGTSGAKPYTDDELEDIRSSAEENYPDTDEEKRKKILFNSKGEYDVKKIIFELGEKEKV